MLLIKSTAPLRMRRVLLTSHDAAQRVGVTVSTLKRWADRGLIGCERTEGGHRRFDVLELERFLRKDQPRSLESEWIARLVDGPRYAIDSALLEARERLGSWTEVAQMLAGVVREIGEQWACGGLGVGDEHIASEALTRALHRVGDSLPSPLAGRRAALACPEDEDHTLGLALAELCLRELGHQVIWLGRRTPTAALIERVDAGGVELVVMSATSGVASRRLASTARALAQACRARAVGLALGGSGRWPTTLAHGVRIHRFEELRAYAQGSEVSRR